MALYESLESRMMKKRLTAVRISPCVYISAVFDSLPRSTISYISGSKRKRKGADNILYVIIDGISLEFEWQQASSGIQDSFQCFSRSQQ